MNAIKVLVKQHANEVLYEYNILQLKVADLLAVAKYTINVV